MCLLIFVSCLKKDLGITIDADQLTALHFQSSFSPHESHKDKKIILNNKCGLGDKILDVIGALTLTQYMGVSINLVWNARPPLSGVKQQNYALKYFQFPSRVVLRKYLELTHNKTEWDNYPTGLSLNPYFLTKLMEFHLLAMNPVSISQVHFLEIAQTFIDYARQISFSSEILERIPTNIQEAIGIHLRKSDKIQKQTRHHENTLQEFNEYVDQMKSFLQKLIEDGEKLFFLASEDLVWKKEFESFLEGLGANILSLEYFDDSEEAGDVILDFAALSQTKKIIQGVKYSTFSMAASLIGNIELVNFLDFETNPRWLLHLWRPYLHLTTRRADDWITENKPFKNEKWLKENFSEQSTGKGFLNLEFENRFRQEVLSLMEN